jgi:outer membrane protein assembly factor BamB
MRRLVLFAVITLAATTAMAQMQGMQPLVAPDGTVLVKRPDFSLTNGMTVDLVAVSPSGVMRWTWQSGAAMHSVAVSETRVFVAGTVARQAPAPVMGRGANAQEVVALALGTGAVQWRQELAGPISAVTVSDDRVYVVLNAGGLSSSMPHMGRGTSAQTTLVALNAATGAILWSVTLQ